MTRSARKFVVTVRITFGRLARCGRRLSGSRHRRYDKSGFSDGSCRLFRDGLIGLYVIIPFSFAALLTGLLLAPSTRWWLVQTLLDPGEISINYWRHHGFVGAHYLRNS